MQLAIKLGIFWLSAAAVVPANAQGADVGAASNLRSVSQGLNPGQLNAIRAVGRNVLAAKHSASSADEVDDLAQVNRLRSLLDKLLASEFDPANMIVAAEQEREPNDQRGRREKLAGARASIRLEARDLAMQFRRKAERRTAHTDSAFASTSAGMPIGQQRAVLFERWSQQLNDALAAEGPIKVEKLRELRQALRPTVGLNGPRGGLTDGPLTYGTPTLQAMPADSKAVMAVDTGVSR